MSQDFVDFQRIEMYEISTPKREFWIVNCGWNGFA